MKAFEECSDNEDCLCDLCRKNKKEVCFLYLSLSRSWA